MLAVVDIWKNLNQSFAHKWDRTVEIMKKRNMHLEHL